MSKKVKKPSKAQLTLYKIYGDQYANADTETKRKLEKQYNANPTIFEQMAAEMSPTVSIQTPEIAPVQIMAPQSSNLSYIPQGNASWGNLSDEEILAINKNTTQANQDNINKIRGIVGIDKVIPTIKETKVSSPSSSTIDGIAIPGKWQIVHRDWGGRDRVVDPAKAAAAIHRRNSAQKEREREANRRKWSVIPVQGGSFGGSDTGGGGASVGWEEEVPPMTVTMERPIILGATKTRTFNEAFAEAYRKGLKVFEFNGKLYAVKLGNNPNWKKAGDSRKETKGAAVKVNQRKKVKVNKNGGIISNTKLIPKASIGSVLQRVFGGKTAEQRQAEEQWVKDRAATLQSIYGDLMKDADFEKLAIEDYNAQAGETPLFKIRQGNWYTRNENLGGPAEEEPIVEVPIVEVPTEPSKYGTTMADYINSDLHKALSSVNNPISVDTPAFKKITPAAPTRDERQYVVGRNGQEVDLLEKANRMAKRHGLNRTFANMDEVINYQRNDLKMGDAADGDWGNNTTNAYYKTLKPKSSYQQVAGRIYKKDNKFYRLNTDKTYTPINKVRNNRYYFTNNEGKEVYEDLNTNRPGYVPPSPREDTPATPPPLPSRAFLVHRIKHSKRQGTSYPIILEQI